MTFSETVVKLGFHLASEVFQRAGLYEAIPFSEWLKVAKVAFTAEEKKERYLLFPFDGNRGEFNEEKGSRVILKELQAKARTFEDHHAIIQSMRSLRLNLLYEDPDPEPIEILKLCELAANFDQCVIVFNYIKS